MPVLFIFAGRTSAKSSGITLRGKPQQNALIEGRPRDKLLASLPHMNDALMIWKNDYNLVRPGRATPRSRNQPKGGNDRSFVGDCR
jgi:hypothetical protein